MVDIFTKKKRSEVMFKVKRRGTKVEVGFWKKIWGAGFRYRKDTVKYFGNLFLPIVRDDLATSQGNSAQQR